MWSTRWRQGLSGLVVLILAVVASVGAHGYGPEGTDNRSQAIQAFESCLEKMYPEDPYFSTDGGRSAKRLLGKCRGEGDAVSKQCQTEGDTSQSCYSKTVALTQQFIRQKERELSHEEQ
jgi:hypothetical protein